MTGAHFGSIPHGADVERLRRLFVSFAATTGEARSPVYATLTDGIVADERLLNLLLVAPGDQRRASLLFAAVNLILAAHPGEDLAAYYPIHGGDREVDEHLVPTFGVFCAQHREELLRLLRTRATQTNDIRRCIALRLGLSHLHRALAGPVALVEVGASAGLNLHFDRFRYPPTGHEDADVGGAPAISCDIRGASARDVLPRALPEITGRLGIDQNPIDLTDPDERAWLEAFIWPEQIEELFTLRGAIDLATSTAPVHVVAGDAASDLAEILTKMPGGEPIAVFTASLLSYLDAAARTAFLGQLDQVALRRPIAWIFAEAPGLVATAGLALPALRGPLGRRNSLYTVGVSMRHDRGHDQLLALADPYLRWMAPAQSVGDDFGWVD